MLSQDLPLKTRYKKLYLININQLNSFRVINNPGSSEISDSCLLNRNTILIGYDN